MSAEASGGQKRPLEINRVPRMQPSEVGSLHGFRRKVGAEAFGGNRHGSEANAVDGDAAANLDISEDFAAP